MLRNSAKEEHERREGAATLRAQLLEAKQVIQLKVDQTSGGLDITRISLTADFYRKAALLYLEQVCATVDSTDSFIEQLVGECFEILEQLGLCTDRKSVV